MKKNPLLIGFIIIVVVLAIMYFLGVFSPTEIKKIESEKQEIGKQIDTLETKRDSGLQSISETSKQSVTKAKALIKNQMPNEKYTTSGDTSYDYMFRKITAE